MKTIHLIIWLITIALISWVGSHPAQAAPPPQEETNLSFYIQEAGTPTAIPSPTLIIKAPTATKTPQPTHAPKPTPPPSDPDTTQLIVLFGVLLVVVILFGTGINMRRFI